jgi:hypothetical protein
MKNRFEENSAKHKRLGKVLPQLKGFECYPLNCNEMKD